MTQMLTKLTLVAPITGQVRPLTDGFSIKPVGGNAVAPVNGTVTEVDAEAQRIVIATRAGWQVTVALNQTQQQLGMQPCEALVRVGNQVKAGQVLASIDMVALQYAKVAIYVQTTVTPADKLELVTAHATVRVDTPVAQLIKSV